jgi:hypothetical protein
MKRIISIKIKVMPDEDADLSFIDPVEDKDLLAAYECGEREMLSVQAEAEVVLSEQDIVQTITSGGLWGIDCDRSTQSEEYINVISQEEFQELANELGALGFEEEQIKGALESNY